MRSRDSHLAEQRVKRRNGADSRLLWKAARLLAIGKFLKIFGFKAPP